MPFWVIWVALFCMVFFEKSWRVLIGLHARMLEKNGGYFNVFWQPERRFLAVSGCNAAACPVFEGLSAQYDADDGGIEAEPDERIGVMCGGT